MDKVELSAKEVKKIALNILVKFAEYCEKNNLTYVLAGGTLLLDTKDSFLGMMILML